MVTQYCTRCSTQRATVALKCPVCESLLVEHQPAEESSLVQRLRVLRNLPWYFRLIPVYVIYFLVLIFRPSVWKAVSFMAARGGERIGTPVASLTLELLTLSVAYGIFAHMLRANPSPRFEMRLFVAIVLLLNYALVLFALFGTFFLFLGNAA